jgi:TonB family protein
MKYVSAANLALEKKHYEEATAYVRDALDEVQGRFGAEHEGLAIALREVALYQCTKEGGIPKGKELLHVAERIMVAAGREFPPSKGSNGGSLLLRRVEANYSDEARAAGLKGTVIVYGSIDPEGHPRFLKIEHRLGLGLDEQAIKAVQQWQFQPATKNCEPVWGEFQAEVKF